MTDTEIIEHHQALQQEASELNQLIVEAKSKGDHKTKVNLVRRLAEAQKELSAGKVEFNAAKQRIHQLTISKATVKTEYTLFTIHHPKRGYRRLATAGSPMWETVLMLAEERPEWGVVSHVFVPDSEEIPETWFDLPE